MRQRDAGHRFRRPSGAQRLGGAADARPRPSRQVFRRAADRGALARAARGRARIRGHPAPLAVAAEPAAEPAHLSREERARDHRRDFRRTRFRACRRSARQLPEDGIHRPVPGDRSGIRGAADVDVRHQLLFPPRDARPRAGAVRRGRQPARDPRRQPGLPRDRPPAAPRKRAPARLERRPPDDHRARGDDRLQFHRAAQRHADRAECRVALREGRYRIVSLSRPLPDSRRGRYAGRPAPEAGRHGRRAA